RHDRGHAAAAQRPPKLLFGRDFRDLLVVQPAGGVDDEAAAFERVVPDRHLDLISEYRPDHGARKLGDMDLLMRRHQGVTGERVVMLPAGEGPDAANSGVDHPQARAVALPPDHALMKSRRNLAPLENKAAVGVENELSIVERSVVAFVDAEHHD